MTDSIITDNCEFDMSKKDQPKSDLIEDKKDAAQEVKAKDDADPAQPVPEKSEEEKLKDELAANKERFLRLAAEFENYKKISQREHQNNVRFANESLILNLLPIIDNLEQAIIAQKKSGDNKNDILIGVEMVLKQMVELLTRYGVEVFSAKGMAFDPARHEAVCEQEDDSVEPGVVVIEYQKGYLLNGRLLRPARVAVAKKSGI